MKSDFKLALDNCDQEPVHIPERIQPFAKLIAFNTDSLEIIQFSENALDYASEGTRTLTGQKLSDLFEEREFIHAIRGVLGLPTIQNQRERMGMFSLRGILTDAAVHVVEKTGVLELEEYSGPVERAGNSISRVRMMLASLTTNQGVDELLASAVKVLRILTGYDRVMGYRFLSDGSGEVAAEEKAPSLNPFLGLRYPAHDIPPQVRKIALRSTIRIIHDIHSTPVDFINEGEKPLDMTLCHSRAISPIHIEYLTNMGIRSTMNLSIIVQGELWGLFAFHHQHPRLLSPDHRSIAELFGHLFSMQLQQEQERQILNRKRQATAISTSLRKISDQEDLTTKLRKLAPEMTKVVDAHGFAVCQPGQTVLFGNCPTIEAVEAICDSFEDELLAVDSLIAVNELSHIEPSAWNQSGGCLAIRIDSDSSRLIFFRNEITHEIRWGGMPEKKIEYGPNGPRLHPRSSFEEYTEKVAGRCEPWTQEDLGTVTEIRAAMLELLYRDVRSTSEEWQRQKQYQDLLIAELNHRVKNTLALVRSIARQTRISTDSLENYVSSFESRINALVTAHDLVGGSGVQWVSLRQLFQLELKAHLNSNQTINMDGPAVSLRSDIAPIIALLIHELTTNATKHGAFSQNGGQLNIQWQAARSGLQLTWEESLRSPITPPRTEGFGLTLVRRAIPHECQGEARVNFKEDGLKVDFWIPDETFQIHKAEPIPVVDQNNEVKEINLSQVDLDSALILEDNLILALESENILKELGCRQVHTLSSLDAVVKLLESEQIDLALVDINISGVPSFPIAEKLLQLGIPFVFVTGYGDRFPIPSELQSIPRVLKPANNSLLKSIILSLLREKT
ncbi:MAG: HWE histidine kinase domain-containing protein [Planctomycetaceae bacterium]